MNHVFKKPFNFEGNDHTALDINLEGLTGADLIAASKEARIMGDVAPVQELSAVYVAVVAAKAAKVPVDFIQALPASEFTKIKMQVQNFLFE
jgi:hypothetical protein